ncbi:MAG: LemA family protein [Leptospiraceae bacterium]
MNTKKKSILGIALLTLLYTGTNCGYNEIQMKDEQVKASWAEVLNQYKRRQDLIPQLVKVVKAFAIQEKEVLVGVIEARSKATSIQATPELVNDPQAFNKFQQAQGDITQALSRLMVTVERYPELKSDQNFRDLQAQIEGTENRITVARKRFIDSVREYNTTVRQFPANLTAKIFGYQTKDTFEVENEEEMSKPPEIDL